MEEKRLCKDRYNIFPPEEIVCSCVLFNVHGKHLWSCRDGQLPNQTFHGQDLTFVHIHSPVTDNCPS